MGARKFGLATAALVLVGGFITALLWWPQPPATVASPSGSPTSPDVAIARVGPLFAQGPAADHGCTASVVDSPQRDLILTAAHCVTGSGAGLLFAPGYRDGNEPYGVWTVVHAYADDAWIIGEHPKNDYTLLRVADQQRDGRTVSLESVVGGDRVGTAPASGQKVRIIAYNAGRNDEAVDCTTAIRYEHDYPAFDCPGFSGGTSGGPWLSSADPSALTVDGVIGGLSYGGCVDTTSYTSPFGSAILNLLSEVSDGRAPSVLPRPTGDGC